MIDSLSTRSNGVPAISCCQARAQGGSDSTTWKSIRTGRPRLVLNTCVKRSGPTPSIRQTPGHQRGIWCGSAISSQSVLLARRKDPASMRVGHQAS